MNILQLLVDGINAQGQRERADSQMTLGELIKQLEGMPPDVMVGGVCNPHSYRGYYSDLAFEMEGKQTVTAILELCRSVMGEVFEGYKGGEFQMGKMTPVWIASYGCCGMKIINLHNDGNFELAKDD